MSHAEAKMSSKGQITIPAAIREALGLKEGDKVDFYLTPGTRRVEIVARNLSIDDLRGCLGHLSGDHPLTPEEIDQAIGDHLAEEHEGVLRESKEWTEFQRWRSERRAG